MRRFLQFLYYISVYLIVFSPVVGSLVFKTLNRTHHLSVTHGISCHQSHIDHEYHGHHWDIIKNKQLSAPPLSAKVKITAAINPLFLYSLIALGLRPQQSAHHVALINDVLLPARSRYIINRAILI
jgi:hypothetical protein